MNTYNIIKFRELKNEVYELVKFVSEDSTSNIEAGICHKKITTKIFNTKIKVGNENITIGQYLLIYNKNGDRILENELDSIVTMSLELIEMFDEFINSDSKFDEFMVEIEEYKIEIARTIVELLIYIIDKSKLTTLKLPSSASIQKRLESKKEDTNDVVNKSSKQEVEEIIHLEVPISSSNESLVALNIANEIYQAYVNTTDKRVSGCEILKFVENLPLELITEFVVNNKEFIKKAVLRNDSLGLTIKLCPKLFSTVNENIF